MLVFFRARPKKQDEDIHVTNNDFFTLLFVHHRLRPAVTGPRDTEASASTEAQLRRHIEENHEGGDHTQLSTFAGAIMNMEGGAVGRHKTGKSIPSRVTQHWSSNRKIPSTSDYSYQNMELR